MNEMKAQVGDYINSSVRGVDKKWRPAPLKVVAIDGDPSDPQTAGYLLEDGTTIGNWEISLDDVLLESEAEAFLNR